MKTSKPFSTISYNTTDFLVLKLDDLIKKGFISFYAFIEHLPEEDEEKKHKHLYLVPDGQVETTSLFEKLIEVDPKQPLKPFKCIPPRSSKFKDWYLYAKHDIDYLSSKGQSRKYNYQMNEFVVSDHDYFMEEIHQMDMSHLQNIKILRSAIQNKVPFEQMVFNGSIPIPLVNQYSKVYEMMTNFENGILDRAERQTHTPLIIENSNFDTVLLEETLHNNGFKSPIIDFNTGEVFDDEI